MASAMVVLAGVEDAAVARAESHYDSRINYKHSHHPDTSMVSAPNVAANV